MLGFCHVREETSCALFPLSTSGRHYEVPHHLFPFSLVLFTLFRRHLAWALPSARASVWLYRPGSLSPVPLTCLLLPLPLYTSPQPPLCHGALGPVTALCRLPFTPLHLSRLTHLLSISFACCILVRRLTRGHPPIAHFTASNWLSLASTLHSGASHWPFPRRVGHRLLVSIPLAFFFVRTRFFVPRPFTLHPRIVRACPSSQWPLS